MLTRDAIGRHLTSEMFFFGDRLPGYSDTIEHPGGLVLIDTGLIDTTPAIEDDGEEWRPHPLPDELVSRVAVVVNTHLHFDHCGGNRLFPGIPIHVQRRELADALTKDDYTVREWVDFPGATYVEHNGEAEILPGVKLLPAPGTRTGIRSSSWRPTKDRLSSAATSGTRSRSSNAPIRRAGDSCSSSQRRPTSRMSRRCASRTRGRSVSSKCRPIPSSRLPRRTCSIQEAKRARSPAELPCRSVVVVTRPPAQQTEWVGPVSRNESRCGLE